MLKPTADNANSSHVTGHISHTISIYIDLIELKSSHLVLDWIYASVIGYYVSLLDLILITDTSLSPDKTTRKCPTSSTRSNKLTVS